MVGSPPCAKFSILQNLRSKDPEKRRQELMEARKHIDFCASVYRYQDTCGRFFLHEHPWSTSFWSLRNLSALRKSKNIRVVCSDGKWEYLLARKRTGWMTNLSSLADMFSAYKCDG